MPEKNILCVVLDTARKQNLSVYETHKDTTPFLQSFADDSVVFDNAISQAPWTLPSHASLFTGEYPSEHGATQESPYLDDTETLASHLSAGGYRTAMYSANAWVSPHTGLTQGFEQTNNFFGPLPNRLESPLASVWKKINDSDTLSSAARRVVSLGAWIYEHRATTAAHSYTPNAISRAEQFMTGGQDPFFVCLNLLDAHLPYTPPLEDATEFISVDERPDTCQNSKAYNAGARDIDDAEWELIKGLYDGELRFLDRQLEQLFSSLSDHDILDDTLVVICADHGELHGEHNLFGHEFGMYDQLLNVPLIIRHPDRASAAVSQQVELLDLYHTLLDYAAVDAPVRPERSIFADAYRSQSTDCLPFPEHAFAEYARPLVEQKQLRSQARSVGNTIDEDSRFNSRMFVSRTPDTKYVHNETIEDELYDLRDDPHEQHNRLEVDISTQHMQTIEANPRVGSIAEGEPLGRDAIDGEIEGRLEDLGYL